MKAEKLLCHNDVCKNKLLTKVKQTRLLQAPRRVIKATRGVKANHRAPIPGPNTSTIIGAARLHHTIDAVVGAVMMMVGAGIVLAVLSVVEAERSVLGAVLIDVLATILSVVGAAR